MKVLILGGTGVIGKELTNSLSKENTVYVSTRRLSQDTDNVHYLRGNAKEVSFINSLSDDWDVIIDLMNYSPDVFSANYDTLLRKTRHYIFTSSSRVYADTGLEAITELSPLHLDTSTDSAFNATGEYALSKAQTENILRSSSYDNWTIIRPYIIYGPSRLQLGPMEKEEWLYRALHGRAILFPESLLDKQTTLTYCKDAALAIRAIAHYANSSKQVFNITTPFHLPWSEVIDIYRKVFEHALGKKMPIKYVDDETFKKFRPGISFYQISKDRAYNRVFSTEKLSQLVDCKEFVTPSEGLSLSLSEFLRKPTFGYYEWAIEGRKDKVTRQFASLGEMRTLKDRMIYLLNRFK